MSSSIPMKSSSAEAPTPANSLVNPAPIAQGVASRPTVGDIAEVEEELSGLGAGGLQSAMLGMVQGKLADLVGRSSGYIQSLPVPVRRNVEGLKGLQIQQTKIANDYKREALELERKYLDLAKPLYARRQEIIAGTAQPTPEELAAAEAADREEEGEDYVPIPTDDPDEKDKDVKGIPGFWSTALQNHPGLAELITERDAEALAFLKDVRLAYLPKAGEDGEFAGKPGFTITFYWDENPFFTNQTLTKTYIYQEEIGYGGDFVYDRAVGTNVVWKEDKDLTREWEIKKQRNKNTNRTRVVRKSRPTASFFNFFAPPVMPSDEDIESGEIDPEDLEEIEERLEVDYQIGEDLKEKIIPRAVDYFTGKALEYELMDSDDDELTDDDAEDDDEDEEDDDDEEDSDDDAPARRRRARAPPKGKSSANVNPEECKQQ